VELSDALAARRSCRAYSTEPVPDDVLQRVCAAALRGPTAGNTSALDLVVVDHPTDYWDVTLPAGRRRDAFRWPGLLDAPLLVIPVVDPDAYVARYAEPDKAHAGLGDGTGGWPVPYWWVDAGAAVMAMLLAATDEGLGSLLFGQFGHEAAVAAAFGVPTGRRAVGTVALGWPALDPAGRAVPTASTSTRRGRPSPADVVHRGAW
jgi:nitroreductase